MSLVLRACSLEVPKVCTARVKVTCSSLTRVNIESADVTGKQHKPSATMRLESLCNSNHGRQHFKGSTKVQDIDINTGIGFLDYIIHQLAKHGSWSL
jgi:imidazoleglycerol phosphate dehydratase HisB